MPHSYRLHPTLPLVLVRIEGNFTITDIRDYAVAIRALPRFGPDLCDMTELVGAKTNASAQDWVQYKAWRDTLPPIRRSAVVAPTNFEYGLARMYELAAERSEGVVGVFRTREEAIRWLGFTPEDVDSG